MHQQLLNVLQISVAFFFLLLAYVPAMSIEQTVIDSYADRGVISRYAGYYRCVEKEGTKLNWAYRFDRWTSLILRWDIRLTELQLAIFASFVHGGSNSKDFQTCVLHADFQVSFHIGLNSTKFGKKSVSIKGSI